MSTTAATTTVGTVITNTIVGSNYYCYGYHCYYSYYHNYYPHRRYCCYTTTISVTQLLFLFDHWYHCECDCDLHVAHNTDHNALILLLLLPLIRMCKHT